MATPIIDSNQWYSFYLNVDKSQALIGTDLEGSTTKTKGAVFLKPTNTSASSQQWQILPVTVNKTTSYTLRSKEGGDNAFMGAGFVKDEETKGNTRPQMFRGDIADNNNVYWNFGSWGDGTWYLTNGANGTDYHLHKKGNGIMAMSPNITAPQNDQRWEFVAIAKIDDVKYSSVNLLGATVASSTANPVSATSSSSPVSTLISSSPTPTAGTTINNTSSGLSTGVKVAIGAVVGGVALIALIILGLYLWKKRKQPEYAPPYESSYDPHNQPTTKYELYHESAAKYEMPSNVVELPNHEQPTELPGHMIEPQKRMSQDEK